MKQIFDALMFLIDSIWSTINVVVRGLELVLLAIPSGLLKVNTIVGYLSTTEDSLLFSIVSGFVAIIVVTSIIRLVVSFIP